MSFFFHKQKKSDALVLPKIDKPTPDAALRPTSAYVKEDPDFSEAAVREKLTNLFIRLQGGRAKKDLSGVRPYLSDAFFAREEAYLEPFRREKRSRWADRIAVLGVSLSGWTQINGTDLLYARLNTRFCESVLDDATGALLGGSKTAETFQEYEWVLSRPTGEKTGRQTGVQAQNCPNCGAPLNQSKTAVCAYCGAVLRPSDFNWVLTEEKVLSRQTLGK